MPRLLLLLTLLPLLIACSENSSDHRSMEANEIDRGLERTRLEEHSSLEQPRTALVIGNSAYQQWTPLNNPTHDATDVSHALRGLGFEVIQALDADNATLHREMRRYRDRLEQRGGVGLFFFAGHGSQIDGENYLIPIDGGRQEADVLHRTLKLDHLLSYLEEAGNELNLVMLDACRDNPFARGWRSGAAHGLAQSSAPRGTLLAYATAPHDVAADGQGRNSPYTAGFLEVLEIPGLPVERVFKEVRIRVQQATRDRQVPWESSSVTGEFYFRPGEDPALAKAKEELERIARAQQQKQAELERLARKQEQERAELERIKQAKEEALTAPSNGNARLTLSTNPSGARWYLDGEDRGVTPAESELPPGRYQLRLTYAGYQEWRGELQLSANQPLRRAIPLTPLPVAGLDPALSDPFAAELAALEEETRRRQDEQEWKGAEAEQSLAAYQRYLNQCDLCAFRTQARQAQDAAQWQQAMAQDTAEAYRGYRTQCDLCAHQAEAQQRVDDQALFRHAQAIGSAAAYQSYLKICHEKALCRHTEEAITALRAIPGAQIPAGTAFRDRLSDGSRGPEMVSILGGCFQMGSPASEEERFIDERQHRVCVDAFALAKHEVTNGEYRRFKPDHHSGDSLGRSLNGDDQPVVRVSWNDAVAYAEWLSRESGQRYRLPTEAEWEYAARAGTTTARYWGDDPDQACRYANVSDQTTSKRRFVWGTIHNCDDGHAVAAPVGRFQANAYRLHDMLGNVQELTCSRYASRYDGHEGHCKSKDHAGVLVVLRGGSWLDSPQSVRSADRTSRAGSGYNFIGFRLAQD